MRLTIVGMTCAACAARVESALQKVEGVSQASVNLLTNSAQVIGDASAEKLVEAVRRAGYSASAEGKSANDSSATEDDASERAFRDSLRRWICSLCLLLALLYFSMGIEMLRLPAPRILANPGATALVQFLFAAAILMLNAQVFKDGFASLARRSPNMNSLVALGAGASYLYSLHALFAIVDALAAGDAQTAAHMRGELYFESSACILVFISLGKLLEARAKGKTTSALRSLNALAPKTATIFRNGKESIVTIEEIRVGDQFLARPGERIAADGVVIEGTSSVDESALTGESAPVDKIAGARVFAGTLNAAGFLRCEATKTSDESSLAQIIRLATDAAASKAPVARLADEISKRFVPFVILASLATGVGWILLGRPFGLALTRAVSVLVVSCPCALGIATPAAIMVGMGVGAKRGLLFKTAETLENIGKTRIVALDKTGVVTTGRPVVVAVQPTTTGGEYELLQLAYALETRSEHPLSKAIVEYCGNLANFAPLSDEVADFQAVQGRGLTAQIGSARASGGNIRFISQFASPSASLLETTQSWERDGITPVFFERAGHFVGAVGVADVPKSDSAQAISGLKAQGLRVVMLTGDAKRVAEAIGRLVGIDEIYAEALPSDKEERVRELSLNGRVAFVGDGINDAPALARADSGVAVGAGTDVAVDSADVVLMKNSLMDFLTALRLSKATLRNVKQNLFWAFIYNIIGIPLAAGLFEPIFGKSLSPTFAALAMSLSSFCVVSNALRLNLLKLDDETASKTDFNTPAVNEKLTKGIVKMKKTMTIEGMMCGHCESRVKKALEALDFAANVDVDHKTGKAVVELVEGATNVEDALKSAVEEQGYAVISIE